MQRRTSLAAISVALAVAVATPDAQAKKQLSDYRYFRALSIDLQGRIPTRAEIADFEKDGFDVDGWIDAHLTGPAYAERVRRIYMDLLRLEIGRSFNFVPAVTTLRRQTIAVEGGKSVYVYFRAGQRRKRVETDGEFCLTKDETGLQFPRNQAPIGTAKPVTQAVLDANTTVVKPWWLAGGDTGFVLTKALAEEPDATPATEVRICKEEAQTGTSGTVYKTDRKAVPAGTPPPYGRLTQLPLDSTYQRLHGGETVACTSNTAVMSSTECGCGPALERCMPGGSFGNDPPAFVIPQNTPLGIEAPIDSANETQSAWSRLWWGEEAEHFLDYVVSEDRDFREVLTAKYSIINGPLAHFYRSIAPATCCGNGYDFDYTQPEPLFDAAKIPSTLKPQETKKWIKVDDRGPHAAGLLTMPIFLTKFGSRRARAHVLYQSFLCREFVAADVKLEPSTEPNLMKRSGCSTCHVALEPLSSYFARVQESDWTWLPESKFPVRNTTKCKDPAKLSGTCKTYYDPAFGDLTQGATLRGAYPSDAFVNAGPPGIADYFTKSDTFAACVASNVTEAFLGRSLSTDDAALRTQLATTFTSSGFKMKALVRALVHADAYKSANNLTSSAWRDNGAGGGK